MNQSGKERLDGITTDADFAEQPTEKSQFGNSDAASFLRRPVSSCHTARNGDANAKYKNAIGTASS